MSMRALLLAFACLATFFGLSVDACLAQSVEGGQAVGAHGSAIRAMGATGFNKRQSRKDPAIVIPPINEGESAPRGLPHGTTGHD